MPADGEAEKDEEEEEEKEEDDARIQSGHSTTSSAGGELPVKLGVHQGHLDELVAMGNIDLGDLRGEVS